jgi:hypothetical protein
MSDIELFPTPAQMIRAVMEATESRCVYCGGFFPVPVELPVYLGVRCVLHRGHDGRRCRWFRSQPTHQFVEWIDPQRTGKASLLD